jgi:hypothetical protein
LDRYLTMRSVRPYAWRGVRRSGGGRSLVALCQRKRITAS